MIVNVMYKRVREKDEKKGANGINIFIQIRSYYSYYEDEGWRITYISENEESVAWSDDL